MLERASRRKDGVSNGTCGIGEILLRSSEQQPHNANPQVLRLCLRGAGEPWRVPSRRGKGSGLGFRKITLAAMYRMEQSRKLSPRS